MAKGDAWGWVLPLIIVGVVVIYVIPGLTAAAIFSGFHEVETEGEPVQIP